MFNNTRVIPARLFGRKETGGQAEFMLERLIDDSECLAQMRVSKTPRAGSVIFLEDGSQLEVCGREGSFFRLRLPGGGLGEKLEKLGHLLCSLEARLVRRTVSKQARSADARRSLVV